MSVFFCEEGKVKKRSVYPLWKDIAYLGAEKKLQFSPPVQWAEGPKVISFHSFKGGVGRTTALTTYLSACFSDKTASEKKILVIDADLEAPGISFWIDSSNRPNVSFVQFLEALQFPPESTESSIDYFAEELKKTSMNISGRSSELFVLPAALSLQDIQDISVLPEHVTKNQANPWVLCDYIHKLGSRLGVDAVFIDLRAGLSEFSSPMIFDPRLDHFFVSTVAPQSVLGMQEILNKLYFYNSSLDPDSIEVSKPSIIVSLVTKELKESSSYDETVRAFNESYPSSDEDSLSSGLEWLEADFLPSLMSIGSLKVALEELKKSDKLYRSATDWAAALYSNSQLNDSSSIGTTAFHGGKLSKVEKLKSVCTEAQFAEGGDSNSLLITDPILNLGKHFSKDVPSIVVIGAKGSGKTFTYKQLVKHQTWEMFLSKAGFENEDIRPSLIFPVLWSENIEDSPEGEIKKAQRQAFDSLGIKDRSPMRRSDVHKKITTAIKNPPDFWDDFWLSLISSYFMDDAKDLEEFNSWLIEKDKDVIFLFDGIEDIFPNASDEVSREAISALLKLPDRLRELGSRKVGLIVFARIDYVQNVIKQNYGQFMQKYLPFQLQWDAESFLRLAYWLCKKAEVFDSAVKEAEDITVEELKDSLEELWGKKLGREKSKEAYSSRWVYAALCDLKGNIQARDLVRFLKFACANELQRKEEAWLDRLLSPESMRKAIPHSSTEKVEEVQKEISLLKNWIAKLDSENVLNRKVPFSAKEMLLDTEVLHGLQELGVIYEDLDSKLGDECLFLPEIYRTGLKFETSTSGRPRMQALLKKNLGSIPL